MQHAPSEKSDQEDNTLDPSPGDSSAAQDAPAVGSWTFQRIEMLNKERERDPSVWIALLERTLPSYLREMDETLEPAGSEFDAKAVAEILLYAPSFVPRRDDTDGATCEAYVDLITYLGQERGRWDAVVWLIKLLIDYSASGAGHTERLLVQSIFARQPRQRLSDLTAGAIDLACEASDHHQAPRPVATPLEELVDRPEDGPFHGGSMCRHKVLGCVWRSIGNMTIGCAGGIMRPEILEIIALLHHKEIMPHDIYNCRPSADPLIVQQPPMLNLFSSRILTSLSDAAWRARQKAVIEKSKALGGKISPPGPELPSASFRVHVAGLKAEVWLELILWSCLHGGWVKDGAKILQTLFSKSGDQSWRPISWRQVLPVEEGTDWRKFESLFENHRPASSGDFPDRTPPVSMERTISSEVVNAYVDALLTFMSPAGGQPHMSLYWTASILLRMKKFLSRTGLSLGAGSWDAVLLRFVDAQESWNYSLATFDRLAQLSPAFGRELTAANTQSLPPYVMDGSAATLSLSHEMLRHYIEAGHVRHAFSLFQLLQDHADENKRRSVVDFLQQRKASSKGDAHQSPGLFTSNFAGIEYPSFHTHIPTSILGPLFDLITNAEAWKFGRWLLYSNDVDGPVVSESLYGDEAMMPPLIRFAHQTKDDSLLSKLFRTWVRSGQSQDQPSSRKLLEPVFDLCVGKKRWNDAEDVFARMEESGAMPWSIVSFARLIRILLLDSREECPDLPSSRTSVHRAKSLMRRMLRQFHRAKKNQYDEDHERLQWQIDSALLVLSTVSTKWAVFCQSLQELPSRVEFELPATAFNLILEGVAATEDCVTACNLVETFWPRKMRKEQIERGWPPKKRPSVLKEIYRTRVTVPIESGRIVIMWNGLNPDLEAIRIVFRQAVIEFERADRSTEATSGLFAVSPSDVTASPSDEQAADDVGAFRSDVGVPAAEQRGPLLPVDTVLWAIFCFRFLKLTYREIRKELGANIPVTLRRALEEHCPRVLSDHKGKAAGPEGLSSGAAHVESRTG